MQRVEVMVVVGMNPPSEIVVAAVAIVAAVVGVV
jgi:hypothetical protein